MVRYSEKIQEAKSLLTDLKLAWVPQDVESTNAHARKIEALEFVTGQAERVDGLVKIKNVLADKLHAERQSNKRYTQVLEETKTVLIEAIESLDSGEKANGLGFAIKSIDKALKGAEPNENQS